MVYLQRNKKNHMYYRVITSADVKQENLFPTLKLAKDYIFDNYPDYRAIILHRRNDHTIKITSYYPVSGFVTKRIDKKYFQNFCDD